MFVLEPILGCRALVVPTWCWIRILFWRIKTNHEHSKSVFPKLWIIIQFFGGSWACHNWKALLDCPIAQPSSLAALHNVMPQNPLKKLPARHCGPWCSAMLPVMQCNVAFWLLCATYCFAASWLWQARNLLHMMKWATKVRSLGIAVLSEDSKVSQAA